jgi:hypothetical protein
MSEHNPIPENKTKDFVLLVMKMRLAQRKYRKSKHVADLQIAETFANLVDAALAGKWNQ